MAAPGPLGTHRRGRMAHRNKPGPIGASVELTYEQFRQAVLVRQIERAKQRGKSYFPAVPDSDLEIVEGKFRMRKAAASACRDVLKAARAALAEEQARGEKNAKLTSHIGISSAYRDYEYDAVQWRSTFKKHYDAMVRGGAFAGQEHGKAAQRHMYEILRQIKAAPGFSNHSNGTAVDFLTHHAGVNYIPDTAPAHRAGWRTTWLYHWLVKHAGDYGFTQLETEEWHWDYA